MSVHKSQIQRLLHISSQLKENRYPNLNSLVEDFRRIEQEEGIPIQCVRKTVLRDVKLLKEEFRCPLAFDRSQNGYYLTHHGWDFTAPALLDEHEMLAAVIGARLAESIFPPPVKNRIRKAVDYLLKNNNPDFLDTAGMASLKILSGLFAEISPRIFQQVFEGWQTHHCVKIRYEDFKGAVSERVFEPHTLVFYENAWYSKGHCHMKHAPRTFALQRIKRAELLKKSFTPDKKIIASVNTDDFLGFDKVKNVKLRLNDTARARLQLSPLHSRQKIQSRGIAEIPAVSREKLFPFLLAQQGAAVLMAPPELCKEFKKLLKNMLAQY